MNDKSLLRGSTKQTLNSEEAIWKLVYVKVVTLHNEQKCCIETNLDIHGNLAKDKVCPVVLDRGHAPG